MSLASQAFYFNLPTIFMDITENQLLKVSLAGTLIGLVALYFVVGSLVVESKKVSEITSSSIGSSVSVNGTINGFKKNGDNVFFSLDDGTGNLSVVLWKNVLDRLKLQGVDVDKIKDGNKVDIIGTVEGYKGQMEIIPTKVWIEDLGSKQL